MAYMEAFSMTKICIRIIPSVSRSSENMLPVSEYWLRIEDALEGGNVANVASPSETTITLWFYFALAFKWETKT